jgi:hypothetical protein
MITPDAFQAWLNTAPAGDAIIWHTGFLARQRRAWTELRGHHHRFRHGAVPGLDQLAREVAKAADQGLVVLFQHRVSEGHYKYLAVRSAPPAPRVIPEGAKGGGCYRMCNRAAALEVRP